MAEYGDPQFSWGRLRFRRWHLGSPRVFVTPLVTGLIAVSAVSVQDVPRISHTTSSLAAYDFGQGFVMVSSDGGAFAFGTNLYHGSMAGHVLTAPVVGASNTPDQGGYWEVGSDGGVYSFGDAPFHGSSGQINPALPAGGSNSFVPNKPIVAITGTSGGSGYWMVAADGGVFCFGNASFHGSSGQINPALPAGGSNSFTPAQAIVGIAATPDGGGYWMVGADGGVYAFGDAAFHGSESGHVLAAPIVGMAITPNGQGYWLVGADGGVFAFGSASMYGTTVPTKLPKRIVGIASTADGGGYWLVGSDGGIVDFGDAGYLGAESGQPLSAPIVGLASTPPSSVPLVAPQVTSVKWSTVSLSWPAVSGASSYRVFCNGALYASTSTPSYTATGLHAKTTYTFAFQAVYAVGFGTESPAVSVTTPATPWVQAAGWALQGAVSGNEDVYGTDSSGAATVNWYSLGGGWGYWSNLGTPSGTTFASQPVALKDAVTGNEIVYARDTSGRFWEDWYTPGGGWGWWIDIGAPSGTTFTSTPATLDSVWSSNEDLYGIDASGRLWEDWYTSGVGWGYWYGLGTPSGTTLVGNPDAVVNATNHSEDVFARSASGELWEISYSTVSESWSSWTEIGGQPTGVTFTSSPMAVIDVNGNEDAYMRDTSGNIWEAWYTTGAGWEGWYKLGSPPGTTLVGDPWALDSTATGNEDVYAIDSVGNLWETWYTPGAGGGWSFWFELGAPPGIALTGDPIAVNGVTGNEDVYARDATGKIWVTWYTPGGGWAGWFYAVGSPP